jgi:hypothetical protein
MSEWVADPAQPSGWRWNQSTSDITSAHPDMHTPSRPALSSWTTEDGTCYVRPDPADFPQEAP